MNLKLEEIKRTREYINELIKTDFTYFLHRSFYDLCPAERFRYSWYIELIAEYLKAIENDEITRLVINIPPRHLKSIMLNVAWPAWLLGRNPRLKIISASYSQRLSIKHSDDTRYLLGTDWYRFAFPELVLHKKINTQTKFATNARGFRLATSIGSTLTGEGGDILIVDDPHTQAQANSEKFRERALSWFDHTFMTRLNNPSKGKVVVIMQRLHTHDLSGYLQEKGEGEWHFLNLPVYEEEPRTIRFRDFSYERPQHEPLNPNIFSHEKLQKIRKDMGVYAFMAQYMQAPLGYENSLIKREWLQLAASSAIPSEGQVFQSWDCAFKTGTNNDYSVCVTVRVMAGKIYVIDILQGKYEFSDLKAKVKERYQRFMPEAILIEDKASGQVLIQDLMQQYTLPIIKVRPKMDKMTRVLKCISLFEAGVIYLARDALWFPDFVAELLSFPKVRHDDQVDALSQFLNWWQEKQAGRMQIRTL